MVTKKIKTIDSIQKEIDKLETEKRKLREAEELRIKQEKAKNEIPLDKLKEYAIVDSCNIWGIFPFIKRGSDVDKFLLQDKEYMPISKDRITSVGFGEEERTVFSKTKVSREYINKAIQIGKLIDKDEDPVFYLKTKDGQIIENQAVIMVIQDLCFMFAPRVENE